MGFETDRGTKYVYYVKPFTYTGCITPEKYIFYVCQNVEKYKISMLVLSNIMCELIAGALYFLIVI